jgi:DNA polymerase
MDLVTLDWETYYDRASGYTLEKMSTEDYVCDPRFEEIGLSVKVRRGDAIIRPVEWFSGTRKELAAWLAQFELHRHAVVAHNCMFDGLILKRYYGIVPKLYIDTLSMARPIFGSYLKRLGLAHLAAELKLGEKGDEVIRADGLRRMDFTPEEMRLYGPGYCSNDVELTEALYLRMRKHMRRGPLPASPSKWIAFPDDEMRVIDSTMRMYIQPQLRLNEQTLIDNLKGIQEKKRGTVAEMEVQGITSDVLRSNKKFAELLEKLGVEVPLKPSPASLKRGDDPPVMTYAFGAKDEGFKEMKERYADDAFISAILAARVSEKSTIAESRTERYIIKARRHRSVARVPINYSGAHTTRDSGAEGENWQNPPKVSKDRLRYAIEAPDGYVIHDADQAQIEARLVAVVAGQQNLVEQFERGEDVYSLFASKLFKREVNRKLIDYNGTVINPKNGKVYVREGAQWVQRGQIPVPANAGNKAPDEKEGKVGKESILGLGFQMGAEKFRVTLIGNAGIDEPIEVVQGYCETYQQEFPMIPELWGAAQGAVKAALMGHSTQIGPVEITPDGIVFPSGMMIAYPNLGITSRGRLFYRRAKDKWDQNLFGGKIVENFIQKLARDIVFWQSNLIRKETGYRHALRVHDSLIHVIPEDKVEAFSKVALEIMALRPPWMPDAPLMAEAKIGRTYGDT